MAENFIDYYELLGIAPSAEIGEIRRAFIVMAKEHHPDAGGSTDRMQQLNQAYKTLMSPTAKASYDMVHGFHSGNTKPGDYKYHEGREVNDIDDMTDAEIDEFLNSIYAEYRNPKPKPKQSVKQRFKKFFEL